MKEFIKQFITNGGYESVLDGLWKTLQIAVLGLLIGIVIGTLIGIVRVMPKYKRLPRILDKICVCYLELFRGTPIVVQLLIGYWVLLPALGISVNSGVPVAVIVFGLNSGAYVSEIMRGGINSVDAGQLEAARAVGLPYSVAMLKIVVPQAIKNILPALCNEFITIIKETSLASTFFVGELMTVYAMVKGITYSPIPTLMIVGVIYFVLNFILSKALKLVERRLKAHA